MSTLRRSHAADGIESFAIYSECEAYRFQLTRRWGKNVKRRVAFIGLNPSTATEVQNDPTVARCVRYAQDWGFDEMTMLNAFGFRATDPQVMRNHPEPVGRHTDRYIKQVTANADLIICCWGTHGAHLDRGNQLLQSLRKWKRQLHCLKVTKAGHPGHPLYLRRDLTPISFEF